MSEIETKLQEARDHLTKSDRKKSLAYSNLALFELIEAVRLLAVQLDQIEAEQASQATTMGREVMRLEQEIQKLSRVGSLNAQGGIITNKHLQRIEARLARLE